MASVKTFTHLDDLAVFGAAPLFSSPRPIGQLAAPALDAFLALARGAFETRRLTGNGPIVAALESELTAFHQVRNCVAVANAGLALMMLAQLFARGRRGEVIMPSFSYRGLPHFAQWAGQLPRFCDVEASTHGLDPRSVAAAICPDTTSIVGVCNFNSPGDIDELCAVAEASGIPIIFDSVYAVGSTYRGRPLGGFGRAEVYSFHATKLLNGFEGGYVTTDDDALAGELRRQRDDDGSLALGMNARLNEIHAALATRSLRDYDAVVAGNRIRFEAYRHACAGLPGAELLPYAEAETEQRNYQMAVLEIGAAWPVTRDQTVALLRAEGAAITAYYSPPLHRSVHAPPEIPVADLPVSDALAERFVQLPVGELIATGEIERIGGLLRFIAEHGAAIRTRIESAR